MLLASIVTILVIFLDQGLKFWIVNQLNLYETKPALLWLFNWTYVQNDGAGWGMLSGRMGLFFVISLIMISYLIWLIYKNRHRSSWALFIYGLLLGGTLGNFMDRLRLGYVVDMFHLTFIEFPVFNVADACLSVGIVALVILVLCDRNSEGYL